MISNFPGPSKIVKLLLIFMMVSSDFSIGFSNDAAISAQTEVQTINLPEDLSFSKHVDHFLRFLIKAPKDECIQIFGRYSPIIAQEIDFSRLYFVSYEEIKDLLNRAVHESIDSLTLFTLPRLQNQTSFAIVINENLLVKIEKNFNFHALFNISAPSSEDGSHVKMKFLVIGLGKLIVGYDGNVKIKHPDYDFATGKYDYQELFTMDAGNDSQGNPCLFNIKGRSSTNGKPQWMKGPLNVNIQSLILTSNSEGRKKIHIQYDLFGTKSKLIDPIPIERLNEK